MSFIAEPRPRWVPPRFVVIDGATGRIASKHATAEEAKATAGSMSANAQARDAVGLRAGT